MRDLAEAPCLKWLTQLKLRTSLLFKACRNPYSHLFKYIHLLNTFLDAKKIYNAAVSLSLLSATFRALKATSAASFPKAE